MAGGKGPEEEEEGGILSSIWGAIKGFFIAIFTVIGWIFSAIYNIIIGIGECLKFIWYPIKERISVCCRWCGNKRQRS